MRKELKQAIVNYIFEHDEEFQLHSAASKEFKNYLYDDKGNYLIGGEEVSEFISQSIKLLINN